MQKKMGQKMRQYQERMQATLLQGNANRLAPNLGASSTVHSSFINKLQEKFGHGSAWFQTTEIKQTWQKSKSHEFFGFPVYMCYVYTILWSIKCTI